MADKLKYNNIPLHYTHKMPLIFTTGEPAGIGVDLAIIHAQTTLSDFQTFGDPDVILARAKVLNIPIKLREHPVKKLGELFIRPFKAPQTVECGQLNKNNATYVLAMLKKAVKICQNSTHTALITGPVHKGIINESGVNFTGHTEFLRDLSGVKKTVMMLATDGLRVALATTHIPLSQVASHIQATPLEESLHIVNQALKNYGTKNPRIVVCGLNPHAGEGGFLGREEIEIINPLIQKLNKQGFNLLGSVPADTAFTPDALLGVDCVFSLYHDQGLPVLKTLGFKKSVNITLGLPFVRTSVDHGTALNLAGTGKISLGSMQHAIDYAKKLTDYD
jgi:4-hydroxythreonine-4-phosphate dehydrogenase